MGSLLKTMLCAPLHEQDSKYSGVLYWTSTRIKKDQDAHSRKTRVVYLFLWLATKCATVIQ